MKRFHVVYTDKQSLKTEKHILADSEQAVFASLREDGLTPVSIKEEKSRGSSLFRQRITGKDVESLVTNLAALLSSGINLDKALTLVLRSVDKAPLQQIVADVQYAVRGGDALSQALSEYPEHFDSLSIRLIEIGEATGTLDTVLKGLSEQLKFQQKMKTQIQQAMIYPAVIIMVCVLSVIFILVSVVPQLSTMLQQKATLPWYTEALLSMSDGLRSTAGVAVLVAVGIGVLVFALSSNEGIVSVRRYILNVLKGVPLVKSLAFLAEQVRFASAMKVTLNSGLPLTDAIELSARTIAAPEMQTKLLAVGERIKTGQRLSESLESAGLLEPMELGYVEVGEETGELDRAFTEIQERKSSLFDSRLATFLKLLEPLLILFMGAIVGGVVIIMMLSIMSAQDVGI